MSTVHSKPNAAGRLVVVVGFLAVVLGGCVANPVAQTGLVTPSEADEAAGGAASAEPTDAVMPEPAGCPATTETMPADAVSAGISDIDGDEESDTVWYSEAEAPFTYGITTASGATVTLADDLAGPNTHSGWTAQLHNGVVVTVLDDGRSASLHALVDCAFVTPIGVDGQPYTFDMQNLRGYGTGVGCLEVNDGLELNGLQASENRDDSYALLATGITVSTDGTSARNGYTAVSDEVPADDPRVAEARTSSCADAPIVSTSGR